MAGGPKTQNVTQTTKLPPEAIEGINFVLGQSQALQGEPVTTPLSGLTLQGVGSLSQGTNPLTEQVFRQTASGAFLDPATAPGLSNAVDFISGEVTESVQDQFSLGGRTGSPAQAITTADRVSQAISPLVFDFLQNERTRQLNAAGLLDDLQGIEAQRQIAGGQVLDEQARAEVLAPFTRLQFLTGPIASAVSGAPQTVNTQQQTPGNTAAGLIGGGLLTLGGLFG